MPVLAAIFHVLFTSSLFSSGFFTSGKRLKQQEAGRLMQIQATRDSPPLNARGAESSGISRAERGGSSYGLPGIGRAMASPDEAAMAAVEEGALGQQRLYEGLRQPGSTKNTAIANGQRSSPQESEPPVPSRGELTAVFDAMNLTNDGKLGKFELQHGMKEAGSPLPDAELEQLFKLADKNADGKIDLAEFMSAVEAKGAASSKRVSEHPVKQDAIVRDTFEQESMKMIDSLIAHNMQEYKTQLPKWAAFMQRLQHDGIQGFKVSDVLVAMYKHCGTYDNVRNGVHEKCIVDKLQPLVGEGGEQDFFVGRSFVQVFVHMVFPKLERQIQDIQALLKTA